MLEFLPVDGETSGPTCLEPARSGPIERVRERGAGDAAVGQGVGEAPEIRAIGEVIDPDGVTTEDVRCPDPTASGIVIKVTRTALPEG